jgi:hypothetical protein
MEVLRAIPGLVAVLALAAVICTPKFLYEWISVKLSAHRLIPVPVFSSKEEIKWASSQYPSESRIFNGIFCSLSVHLLLSLRVCGRLGLN